MKRGTGDKFYLSPYNAPHREHRELYRENPAHNGAHKIG